MKNSKYLIGVLVVLGLGFAAYRYFNNFQLPAEEPIEREEPITSEEEELLEFQVGVEIAEGAEKIRLSDVSGGQGIGIATREDKDGAIEITVIASLPTFISDNFYQVWLANGENKPIGELVEQKGGWTLTYQSKEDLSGYSRILVTRETGNEPTAETTILEGEF